LDAIDICRGYVEAQHEYALQKREGYDANQYAQRIVSTPGKQDGLHGKTLMVVGADRLAKRLLERSNRATPAVRIISWLFLQDFEGQGPAAPIGEMDFVVKGVMIGASPW